MIIAVTGHRPNKLGNDYNLTSPLLGEIRRRLAEAIVDLRPCGMISGMALGIDTLWARLALEYKVPLTCAIPFKGQEKKWPMHSQDEYNYMLSQAHQVITVSEGGYDVFKMQVRNVWMVDHSQMLIAVWDGTPGGTANCVNYANTISNRKYVISRIDPSKIVLLAK